MFSCKICELFKNTFFYRTPRWLLLNKPGDLCGSFSKGNFWSFSLSLPWLSNIKLNLLTKSSFDISLLLKLKYAVISLILWTMNKLCYSDSLCLHEYTNERKRKKATFGRSEKVEINISGKYRQAKLLRVCKSKKMRCRRDIPLAFGIV